MLIDNELKKLLQDGEFIEQIELPVEVGLLRNGSEKHLVAFVGGTPVFHYTYPANVGALLARAAVDYVKRNLWRAVFSTVSGLGSEAVELPEYVERKKVARLWAKETGDAAKVDALQRQQAEIERQGREARSLEPLKRDHEWRVDLLRSSLEAIAELRRKKKGVSQKTVAPMVYHRLDVHQKESALSQYGRELREGFGRPARVTFTQIAAVNKTWNELTLQERSDLNCPEPERLNRRRRKGPAKKVHSV